jgi:hypothetical protein
MSKKAIQDGVMRRIEERTVALDVLDHSPAIFCCID